MLACALASTAGTLAPYALARRFGKGLAARAARWLDVDPRAVDSLAARVGGLGFRGVAVARLVPGLRVAVSLVAGTARVPRLEFSLGVFVAAALYWSGWALLGAVVGPRVEDLVSPAYLRLVVIAIPVVVATAFAGRVLWARRRAR